MKLRFSRLYAILALLPSMVVGGANGHESLNFHFQGHMMKVIDIRRPEPVLFLLAALDAMLAYHEVHKEFPENWSSVDINFANGGFYIGDPNTHPTAYTGRSWRPKGCKYTYWIEKATKESFLIWAINPEGILEYEITQDLEHPVSLSESNRE